MFRLKALIVRRVVVAIFDTTLCAGGTASLAAVTTDFSVLTGRRHFLLKKLDVF